MLKENCKYLRINKCTGRIICARIVKLNFYPQEHVIFNLILVYNADIGYAFFSD